MNHQCSGQPAEAALKDGPEASAENHSEIKAGGH
jgi:hypothetical protein